MPNGPKTPDDLSQSTSQSQLRTIFESQRSAFVRHGPLSYEKRREALQTLLQGLFAFEAKFISAMKTDFGNRSVQEIQLLDFFPVIDEIRFALKHLKDWMKPHRVSVNWQFWPGRAWIETQPLGVVGVIGAWNYQLFLTLGPLVNAMAAGNHVILKPSELAPSSGEAIAELIKTLFPPEYVTVVTGGPELGAEFSKLPWDHLIFTGSTRVGKLVMKAAAENLTPVTLELGGKSPAFIHSSYPLARAADRICTSKFWNAGQTCVAPDYVLVPEEKVDEFSELVMKCTARRFAHWSENPDYTWMIQGSAWERMSQLVEDARKKGARILQEPAEAGAGSANPASRAFPPTVIVNAAPGMRVMEEEIFGPLLPVIGYQNENEALDWIRSRPRPLALYYFDQNLKRAKKVLRQTHSGGATLNDCMYHLPQHNLPFGGVGESGIGAYHGYDGYCAFSKRKGVYQQSEMTAFLLEVIKPPYGPWSSKLVSFFLKRPAETKILRFELDD